MPATKHRRTKVVAHVPTSIAQQFHARYPEGAADALVNACFHAAVRYPELAWRLVRNYANPSVVLPDDWTPPVRPEDDPT